jgi:hypothetical protein
MAFMSIYEEGKLIKVLEHFLSLHEADEVYNAIFDPDTTVGETIKLLDSYKSVEKEN